MAEFDPLVRPPDARDFASTATMFGNLLGNLPQVFRQGAAQADLQQAAQSGQLLNPDGTFNYPLMMNILARAGDVSGIQGLLSPMQAAQGDVLARNLLGGGGGYVGAGAPGAGGMQPSKVAVDALGAGGGPTTIPGTLPPTIAGQRDPTYNFNPDFAQRLQQMWADAPASARQGAGFAGPTAGYRSREQQAAAWEDSAHGRRYMAAPPGGSYHESGAAADFEDPTGWFHQHAAEYGLSFPFRDDYHHLQVAGPRPPTLGAGQGVGQGTGQPPEFTLGNVRQAVESGIPGTQQAGGVTFPKFKAGIKNAESGGDRNPYQAVESTGTGHRVVGAFRVYDDNIGPWTQEVLGRRMTLEQFRDDPKAQEAVADAKLGEYVQKYGYAGAARAWLAGEGGMNDPKARDKYGSNPYGYSAKVLAYARGKQINDNQVASAARRAAVQQADRPPPASAAAVERTGTGEPPTTGSFREAGGPPPGTPGYSPGWRGGGPAAQTPFDTPGGIGAARWTGYPPGVPPAAMPPAGTTPAAAALPPPAAPAPTAPVAPPAAPAVAPSPPPAAAPTPPVAPPVVPPSAPAAGAPAPVSVGNYPTDQDPSDAGARALIQGVDPTAAPVATKAHEEPPPKPEYVPNWPRRAPEPLPPGFAPGQEREAVQALEYAATRSPHAAKVLLDKAQRIRDDMEGIWHQGYLIKPTDGQILFDPYAQRQQQGRLNPEMVDAAARYWLQTGQYITGSGRSILADVAKRQIIERAEQIANERGVSMEQIAFNQSTFKTRATALRPILQRAANLDLAENEVRRLIPRVKDVSDKVDRTRYPTLNSLILGWKTQTGDPNVVRMRIAMGSLVPVYARVLKTGGGVLSVSDLDHARDYMNEKWGNLSVDAALDQMNIEMDAAKDSAIDSMEHFGITPQAAGFQMERSKPRGAAGGGGGGAGAPRISTRAQYDALPSGTSFIGDDGKRYRKP